MSVCGSVGGCPAATARSQPANSASPDTPSTPRRWLNADKPGDTGKPSVLRDLCALCLFGEGFLCLPSLLSSEKDRGRLCPLPAPQPPPAAGSRFSRPGTAEPEERCGRSGGKPSPSWPRGRENPQRGTANSALDPVGPSVYCHRAPNSPSALPRGVTAATAAVFRGALSENCFGTSGRRRRWG